MAESTNPAFRASSWGLRAVLIAIGVPVLMAAGGPSVQDQQAVNWLRYGPGVTNHPVGVVPSAAVRVPADWPLGPDGTIMCSTCHYRMPAREGEPNSYLRPAGRMEEASAAFCVECHGASDNRSAAGMHWMAVRVAHVKPGARVSKGPSGSLDAESRLCLGCHDGVTATESANPTASSPRRFSDMRRQHPVGIRYPDRTRGKSGARLRSSRSLPQRVRLPEGRVSCVSCHNLYETKRHRLSVPIEESELCFTCHDMR